MKPVARETPLDSRFVGRNWFSPGWSDENEIGALEHGEFQTPVWNCVRLAIASDRARDAALEIGHDVSYIPGTSHDERGGDLQRLLECVARARVIETQVRRDARRPTSKQSSRREPERRALGKERRIRTRALATMGLVAAFVVGVRAKRSLGRLAA